VGTRGSVSRHARDVVGNPFFLRVVTLSNTIDDFVKGCHIRRLHAESVRAMYVNWCGKHTCHVYQVSRAGCTSIRITVTLGYE
jgi:hypothetical protein